jgi:hypothetical protein
MMSEDNLNTLEMLKVYARGVCSEISEKMPPELLCSVMMANNRVLTAAIIENGGKLVISPDSVSEMLTNIAHVCAVANEDGSLTLTLAAKDDIIAKPEALPL